MCGFAGSLILSGQRRSWPERLAVLKRMSAQLEHRGPDDEQVYDDGYLSFVFRRLSIIDVDGGSQPLRNEDGSLVAAVNGEVYNHRELRRHLREDHVFRSRSDSEIVVHLFEELGRSFLELLNGMYAVLVWNPSERRLLLARDRLGIKPLYYVHAPKALLFGSELKAVLAHPDCPRRFSWRDVDWSHLEDDTYTSPNYTAVPSFVEGVELLHGGHSLEATPSGIGSPRCYWSLSDAIDRSRAEPPRRPEEYVTEYATLIEESVTLQMTSDVPVGVFLSGGLDSSIITAVAARSEPSLACCFSVAEPGTISAGDLGRARSLTDQLGLPFAAVRFDHGEFARELDFSLDAFEYFVWMIDAPRFAPEYLFKHELHRYAKTRLPMLKVILLGQGADEFAGGYSTSLTAERTSWHDYLVESLAPRERARLLAGRGVPAEVRPFVAPDALGDRDLAPYHREMLARVFALQSHNLWNEDRVSSSQGVEARVPFLDHRLVELLAAVPAELHAELFWNKAIVRRAASRWLPECYTGAPKVLFWESGDASSVHYLMRACLERAYPAFRESYGTGPDAIFPARLLDKLHTAAEGLEPGWTRASRTLLGCMSIAVFDRLCRSLAQGASTIIRLGPPSPLAALVVEAAGTDQSRPPLGATE